MNLLPRLVDTVAIQATHIRLAVRGTLKAGVLSLVTFQALLVNLLGRRLGKAENLGRVSAALDVCLAGSVTTLACRAILTVHQRNLGVRVAGKSL